MRTIIGLILVFLCIQSFGINRESGGRQEASAVFVNFTSIGSGIDGVTLQLVDRFITRALLQGVVIEQFRQQLGREGETLICAHFNEPLIRSKFIKEIAPSILKDRSSSHRFRTFVRVGVDCSDYNAATEQDLVAYSDQEKLRSSNPSKNNYVCRIEGSDQDLSLIQQEELPLGSNDLADIRAVYRMQIITTELPVPSVDIKGEVVISDVQLNFESYDKSLSGIVFLDDASGMLHRMGESLPLIDCRNISDRSSVSLNQK